MPQIKDLHNNYALLLREVAQETGSPLAAARAKAVFAAGLATWPEDKLLKSNSKLFLFD